MIADDNKNSVGQADKYGWRFYEIEKMLHQLDPDDEKPEVPVFVKLYNAFVFAHDTLSAATPPRPNKKRKTFQKIPTL